MRRGGPEASRPCPGADAWRLHAQRLSMKLDGLRRTGARSRLRRRARDRVLQGRVEVELVVVKTTGDRLSAAGSPIEWKGDFTRELDEALLDGRIDFAVHSMKDVPTQVPEGLVLAAVPVREDPRRRL